MAKVFSAHARHVGAEQTAHITTHHGNPVTLLSSSQHLSLTHTHAVTGGHARLAPLEIHRRGNKKKKT